MQCILPLEGHEIVETVGLRNDKADKQNSIATGITLFGIWLNSLSERIYDTIVIENS